jgi:pilus assembly protein Flp/PilA
MFLGAQTRGQVAYPDQSLKSVIRTSRERESEPDTQRSAQAVQQGTRQMMKLVRNLKNNTSGASAAEYALIVAVLGGLVVAGATYFGQGLRDGMQDSGKAIDETSTDTAIVANNS